VEPDIIADPEPINDVTSWGSISGSKNNKKKKGKVGAEEPLKVTDSLLEPEVPAEDDFSGWGSQDQDNLKKPKIGIVETNNNNNGMTTNVGNQKVAVDPKEVMDELDGFDWGDDESAPTIKKFF